MRTRASRTRTPSTRPRALLRAVLTLLALAASPAPSPSPTYPARNSSADPAALGSALPGQSYRPQTGFRADLLETYDRPAKRGGHFSVPTAHFWASMRIPIARR